MITVTFDEKVVKNSYYNVVASGLTDADSQAIAAAISKEIKNGTRNVALTSAQVDYLKQFAAPQAPAAAEKAPIARVLVPAGKFSAGEITKFGTVARLGKSWAVGAKEEEILLIAGFPGADFCQYAYIG